MEPQWKGVCIHHSATKDTESSSWEAIRTYHVETNRWSDIGYHFGVEKLGSHYKIRIGRPTDKSGAHARGLNSSYIGICVVGNYDSQILEKRTIETLALLIKDLSQTFKFEISEESIKYHNEVASKTCPGIRFIDKKELIDILKET